MRYDIWKCLCTYMCISASITTNKTKRPWISRQQGECTGEYGGMEGKKDNLPLNYNLKSILTSDVCTGQGKDDKDELHTIKGNTGSSTERRMGMFV